MPGRHGYPLPGTGAAAAFGSMMGGGGKRTASETIEALRVEITNRS